jgi:outer membrane protein
MDTRQAVSNSRSASARLALVAASALMAVAATAHAGDFMVRARVLQLDPANESYGPHPALANNAVSVSSRLIWELDASYFMTPNWAVEVIATTPPKHTVSTGGARLGTLRHLPPTVTLQYHLAPTNASVRPYIGVGLNYTRFSAVDLDAGPALGASTAVPLKIKKNSWGTAVQIGADFPINEKLSINVDFKKIDIGTKVSLADGTYLGTVKVNPVLFGAGIGYKF